MNKPSTKGVFIKAAGSKIALLYECCLILENRQGKVLAGELGTYGFS